jgi:diaminohydroxyphosphoribosylaminopyrimidine deaminase / 5-amino-6-(5-phosphoribosylamino)uracil reductase
VVTIRPDVDTQFMRRALLLAERGRGQTSPNPMVGAVVVDADGVVVGEGYHERAGTPHAEVHALDAAGERARGATLYSTLEPCCHVGRTGPCSSRIIGAGIARVVAAMRDPNPLVAGGGFAELRAHGIRVDEGVLEDEARALTAEFTVFIRERRPFVTLKAAASLDGYIAAAPGVRTKITGAAATRVAQFWRAEVDAVGVGSGTVLADDPLLTAREVYRDRPLTRIVFDRRLRTPASARLLGTLRDGPVLIVTSRREREAHADRARVLEDAGAGIVAAEDGRFGSALKILGEQGLTSLLLEGGTEIHVAAWDAGMIDRVALLVGPEAVGAAGVPFLGDRPFAVFPLCRQRVEPCGADVVITGDVHRSH